MAVTRIEFGESAQPGEVTLITVEDRVASQDAATRAEDAATRAEAAEGTFTAPANDVVATMVTNAGPTKTALSAAYALGDLGPVYGGLAALYNADNQRCEILMAGDSITEGFDSPDIASRAVDVAQKVLRSKFGPAVQGDGYIPARYFSTKAGGGTLPSGWNYSGTWDDTDFYYGPGFKGKRGSVNATVAKSRTMTSVRLFFARRSTTDKVTIAIDDGATAVTLDIGAGVAAPSLVVWESRAAGFNPASGAHNVVITVTGGTPVFCGGYFYNGDENAGVAIWDGSHSGAKMSDLAATGNPNTNWLNSIPAVNPNLIICEPLTNDSRTVSNGYDVATYKTNAQSFVTKVRAQKANVPILFMPPYQHDQATIAPWNDYIEALRQVAAANPFVAVWPISNTIPQLGTADVYDLSSDGVHPRAILHRMMGRMIASLLSTFPLKFSR